MKKRKPSKQVLAFNQNLKSLVNKVNFLNQLNQRLQTLLDAPLAKHCKVANVRQNILILYVDSAAWGMKLRYFIPQLLEALRNDNTLAYISSIEYKIRPADHRKTALSHKKVALKSEYQLILDELRTTLENH